MRTKLFILTEERKGETFDVLGGDHMIIRRSHGNEREDVGQKSSNGGRSVQLLETGTEWASFELRPKLQRPGGRDSVGSKTVE